MCPHIPERQQWWASSTKAGGLKEQGVKVRDCFYPTYFPALLQPSTSHGQTFDMMNDECVLLSELGVPHREAASQRGTPISALLSRTSEFACETLWINERFVLMYASVWRLVPFCHLTKWMPKKQEQQHQYLCSERKYLTLWGLWSRCHDLIMWCVWRWSTM